MVFWKATLGPSAALWPWGGEMLLLLSRKMALDAPNSEKAGVGRIRQLCDVIALKGFVMTSDRQQDFTVYPSTDWATLWLEICICIIYWSSSPRYSLHGLYNALALFATSHHCTIPSLDGHAIAMPQNVNLRSSRPNSREKEKKYCSES